MSHHTQHIGRSHLLGANVTNQGQRLQPRRAPAEDLILVPNQRCRTLLTKYAREELSEAEMGEMTRLVEQHSPCLVDLMSFARAAEPDGPARQCPPKLRGFLDCVSGIAPAVGCESPSPCPCPCVRPSCASADGMLPPRAGYLTYDAVKDAPSMLQRWQDGGGVAVSVEMRANFPELSLLCQQYNGWGTIRAAVTPILVRACRRLPPRLRRSARCPAHPRRPARDAGEAAAHREFAADGHPAHPGGRLGAR